MLERVLSVCLLAAGLSFAQQPADLTGDYAGSLGPYHLKLHLIAGHDGALSGTVDSSDQGLIGIQCTDIHVNGQTLSFTVPVVHGTWIGFIGENGTSLSGTWSQGQPMPLNFARVATTAAPASGAPPPQAAASEVKWDDYTFKFLAGGQMAQVFQGGKIVGSIVTVNGAQQVIPLRNIDADKLKKSFDDYKAFAARSHSQNSSDLPTTAAPPAGQTAGPDTATGSPTVPANGNTAGVSAIRFDEASHTITVPRPDGVTVTFVGEDVKIAGFHKLNYIVRHQKGSPGRFLEHTLGHPNTAGGSLSGGGEEFLRDGGGIIYDSGMGTNSDMQVNSPVLKAKQLSQVAVDAVADVRQVPGHESFTPPGYNTLKEISQYRLRSDGSR